MGASKERRKRFSSGVPIGEEGNLHKKEGGFTGERARNAGHCATIQRKEKKTFLRALSRNKIIIQ